MTKDAQSGFVVNDALAAGPMERQLQESMETLLALKARVESGEKNAQSGFVLNDALAAALIEGQLQKSKATLLALKARVESGEVEQQEIDSLLIKMVKESRGVHGELQSVGFLLENGANPNASEASSGRTALHYAAIGPCWIIAETLLAHPGINKDQKDSKGKTALDLAKEAQATDTASGLYRATVAALEKAPQASPSFRK